MPSANPKLEKQASTETVDPIRQAITVVEHKIRNLEKRKVSCRGRAAAPARLSASPRRYTLARGVAHRRRHVSPSCHVLARWMRDPTASPPTANAGRRPTPGVAGAPPRARASRGRGRLGGRYILRRGFANRAATF